MQALERLVVDRLGEAVAELCSDRDRAGRSRSAMPRGYRLSSAGPTLRAAPRAPRADAPPWRREPLGVECAPYSRAGGGDRLPVDVVLDVAGREHAGDVRLGRARASSRDSPPRRGRASRGRAWWSGRVRSRRRPSARRARSVSSVACRAQPQRRSSCALAEHLVDDGVGDELDLLVRPGAVEHDRRGAELVATVDDA